MTLSEEEKKTEELAAQGGGEEAEEKEATSTPTQEAPKEFICGVCGKAFERVESLKSHRLRSHKISPRVEVGQEGVTEHAPASTTREAPPSTSYPTDRDLLFNILKDLGYHKAQAVIGACDTRGFYVATLYSILQEMGASEAIIKPTLVQWSHLKDQAIPYGIKARLGIRDVYDEMQSRSYGGFQGGYDPRYGYPAQQREGDILTGVGNLIRAMKEDGGFSQQGGGDNELITQLQGQVSNLQKELHELKEDQAKREVQGLRQEIGELKELVKKNSGDETLKFLDKRFVQFGSKVDRLTSSLEPIGRAYSRRVVEGYTGETLPESESPAGEKSAGKRSLMNMLPNELIEEEAEKEAREAYTGGDQTS